MIRRTARLTPLREHMLGTFVAIATAVVVVLFALATLLFAYQTIFGDFLFLIPTIAMFAGTFASWGLRRRILSPPPEVVA